MGKRALVFGASGVTGWSLVNELLHDYPEHGAWDQVVAMTNRPLMPKDSLWPVDSRLQIVSGVDLLAPQEKVRHSLENRVSRVSEITHVYYLAYKASPDVRQEYQDAVKMFKHAIASVDTLSLALEFIVLQTGAKMYGCHLLDQHPTDYIHVPLSEDHPRLKHDLLFYHPQLDWLSEYAESKQWKWCDTRPDIIVGFVPNQNAYSLAQSLGIFLTLYAHVEGTGACCRFPGTSRSWGALSNDSSADMIARETIHLSLKLPAKQNGEGFNVADAKRPSSWREKWPQICGYFGLQGLPPADRNEKAVDVREYVNDHLDIWHQLEKKHNLREGVADSALTYPGFENFLLKSFDFDRHYDMTKMYSTPPDDPFSEERSTLQAWGGVFDRMREGGILPKDSKAS